MKSKRCYHQYCGLAKALDIVGERWTLLILRDLMLGPWRYSDLLERMPGITTNLLANRLKEIEGHGLIKKSQVSSLGSPHVYELTKLGRQLEPAMLALSQFGFNFMHDGPETDEQVDTGRALLNLKSRYKGKQKGTITFNISTENEGTQQAYQIRFSPNNVDVRWGIPYPSETQVSLSLRAYADFAFKGIKTQTLERKKQVKIEGNREVWKKFINAFGFQ